jgi:hypothetical protein
LTADGDPPSRPAIDWVVSGVIVAKPYSNREPGYREQTGSRNDVKRGNDYILVSTNTQQRDGSRANGTVLDPSGPAIQRIRRGEEPTTVRRSRSVQPTSPATSR